MADAKQVKVDNWGVFFLQKLQQFYNNTDYCDLILQFDNNVQLKVHRLVMNACTEYFQSLEHTCELIDDCLVMPIDLEADIVVPIVNFMYTGQLEFQMSNFEKLYSTAQLMNMTVLTKMLDAQRVAFSPSQKVVHKPKPMSIKLSVKDRYISTQKRDYIESVPSRKLPVWKRKRDSDEIVTPYKYNESSIKYKTCNSRVSDNSPRPTRFEWPDEETGDFISSFDDISYGSQPLPAISNETPVRNSSLDFEEIKRTASVVKNAPADLNRKPKNINLEEVKEYVQEHRLRTDYVLNESNQNDDSNDGSYYNELSECSEDSTSHEGQSPSKKLCFSVEDNENITDKSQSPGNMSDNHAKIISEVLKKYPHLVKKNKNIKLKIMQKGSLSQIQPAKPKQSNRVNYVVKKTEIVGNYNSHSRPAQKTWYCKNCNIDDQNLRFDNYDDYNNHMSEYHPDKSDNLACSLCGFKSIKRNNLVYHMYSKHNIALPPNHTFPRCDKCDYVALNNVMYVKHKEMHTTEYKCQTCNKVFTTYMKLIKHSQSMNHSKGISFDCRYCPKKCLRASNLITHMTENHKLESRKEGLFDDEENNAQKSEKIKILSDVKIESNKKFKQEKGELLERDSEQIIIENEENYQKLEPSSEAEALSNVASGIATSLGLVDTIVVLDENQYVLHSTDNTTSGSNPQEQFILPEMIENQINNINTSCILTQNQNTHITTTIDQNALIANTSIGSTDELVMVLTDHNYSDGNNTIGNENSNIVVLYSHPVEGQPTQYISQQGNIILNPQTGMLEMGGSQIQVLNSDNILTANNEEQQQDEPEESIEMIQEEINQFESKYMAEIAASQVESVSTEEKLIEDKENIEENNESSAETECLKEPEPMEEDEVVESTDEVPNDVENPTNEEKKSTCGVENIEEKIDEAVNEEESSDPVLTNDEIMAESNIDEAETEKQENNEELMEVEDNKNEQLENLDAVKDVTSVENVENESVSEEQDESIVASNNTGKIVDISTDLVENENELIVNNSEEGNNESNEDEESMIVEENDQKDITEPMQEESVNEEITEECNEEITEESNEEISKETNEEIKEGTNEETTEGTNEETTKEGTNEETTEEGTNEETTEGTNEEITESANEEIMKETNDEITDTENTDIQPEVNEESKTDNVDNKLEIEETKSENEEVKSEEKIEETNNDKDLTVVENDKNDCEIVTKNEDKVEEKIENKTCNNVNVLVSDWCDDDSAVQSTDSETVSNKEFHEKKTNGEGHSVTKNNTADSKITKLLDDWDDVDTDSQQSGTEQATKQVEQSAINNLIEDWEDDE